MRSVWFAFNNKVSFLLKSHHPRSALERKALEVIPMA